MWYISATFIYSTTEWYATCSVFVGICVFLIRYQALVQYTVHAKADVMSTPKQLKSISIAFRCSDMIHESRSEEFIFFLDAFHVSTPEYKLKTGTQQWTSKADDFEENAAATPFCYTCLGNSYGGVHCLSHDWPETTIAGFQCPSLAYCTRIAFHGTAHKKADTPCRKQVSMSMWKLVSSPTRLWKGLSLPCHVSGGLWGCRYAVDTRCNWRKKRLFLLYWIAVSYMGSLVISFVEQIKLWEGSQVTTNTWQKWVGNSCYRNAQAPGEWKKDCFSEEKKIGMAFFALQCLLIFSN